VEKRLGYKLSTLLEKPDLTGPAIKIGPSTTQAEWKNIFLQKPDGTIIESPTGKRITVGELKQAMAQQVGRSRSRTGGAEPISRAKTPEVGRSR